MKMCHLLNHLNKWLLYGFYTYKIWSLGETMEQGNVDWVNDALRKFCGRIRSQIHLHVNEI